MSGNLCLAYVFLCKYLPLQWLIFDNGTTSSLYNFNEGQGEVRDMTQVSYAGMTFVCARRDNVGAFSGNLIFYPRQGVLILPYLYPII